MKRTMIAAALIAATGALGSAQAASGPDAAGAAAHEGYHLIFRTGTLGGFAPGDVLSYRTERTGIDPMKRGADGALTLTLDGDGKVRLDREQDDATRPVASFDADVGNPMAMYFLESLVHEVSAATGGGKFYIRNRLKEALLTPRAIEDVQAEWQGAPAPARRVTLTPFQGDPNAARMGPFEALAIEVTVSADAPGWYLSLVAATPETAEGRLYSSRVTLEDRR